MQRRKILQKIIVDSREISNSDEDGESLIQSSRRDFLKTSAVVAGGLALSEVDMFASSKEKNKTLTLHNIHLNQTVHAHFLDNGRYNISGLFQIDKAMMDHHSWQIARIDLKLVNVLYEISKHLGKNKKINLISGYRSPKTNRNLRKHSHGVAKKSYHMKAEAADIQVPGVRLSKLRAIVKGIQAGGVGYYPRSNFVHLDVGPIRSWRRG